MNNVFIKRAQSFLNNASNINSIVVSFEMLL